MPFGVMERARRYAFSTLLARVFDGERHVNRDAHDENGAQRKPETIVELASQNHVENDARRVTRRPTDQRLKFNLPKNFA